MKIIRRIAKLAQETKHRTYDGRGAPETTDGRSIVVKGNRRVRLPCRLLHLDWPLHEGEQRVRDFLPSKLQVTTEEPMPMPPATAHEAPYHSAKLWMARSRLYQNRLRKVKLLTFSIVLNHGSFQNTKKR